VVDRAVWAYAHGKSKLTLYALADAFLDWYQSKANWLQTLRSANMIELVNYIKTEATKQVPGVGGYIFNRRMAQRMLDEMMTSPLPFLQRYKISVAGAGDSPALDFRVSVMCDDVLFDPGQLVPNAAFAPIKGCQFSSKGLLYGPKVAAVSIHMHEDFTAANNAVVAQGKLYPVSMVRRLLMTGMLTGCSFLIRTNVPLACTHLKPVGQNGIALQNQLVGFHMPAITIYGVQDYGGGAIRCHVIGFNIQGWRIYSQRSNAHGVVPPVHQIYP
jgi:hypothetical protein